MQSISWKGVIIAGIFDIVVSSVLGIMLVFGVWMALRGNLSGTQTQQLTNLTVNPWVHGAVLLAGCAVSIVAGYMAAAIAKRAELLNGALSSCFCVAEGLFNLVGTRAPHVAEAIFFIILSPLLGLAGGYLFQRRRTLS